MSLAVLYECPDTDEQGIRATAREMGVDLELIPFRKVSVLLSRGIYGLRTRRTDYHSLLEGVGAVINRAQSKNRRLYAATILETIGKYVLNPFDIESACFSKFRTLLKFWKKGVPIPRTVYVPCDSHDKTAEGTLIHNEVAIADLIQRDLGNGKIVLKPDAGTHGKGVRLAPDHESLVKLLDETEPSIVNPIGFVAQEFVDKWFYDLRIIVAKEHGDSPHCYETALARAGLNDFRTNTYLGNMVFGVELPDQVRSTAIEAAKAVAGDAKAWLLALDAMPEIGEDRFVDSSCLKAEFEKLAPSFEKVKEVKRDNRGKNSDFNSWNRRLEDAYAAYKNEEAYWNIAGIIEKSLMHRRDRILFHEANSCPEFWEQTRLIAGINVALPLLRCAKSIAGTVPARGI